MRHRKHAAAQPHLITGGEASMEVSGIRDRFDAALQLTDLYQPARSARQVRGRTAEAAPQ